MALREQASAVDELSMATTRIRLRLEHEPYTEPPQPNILEEYEVISLLNSERIR